MDIYRVHLRAASVSGACLEAHAHAATEAHASWERNALTRALESLLKLTEVAPTIQARPDKLNADAMAQREAA